MTTNKIRAVGAAVLVVIWAALTAFAWFKPADAYSETERSELDQFPELTVETVLSGDFMQKFEDYTLDQFPLRDRFREMKALFHYYAMQQMDNNGSIWKTAILQSWRILWTKLPWSMLSSSLTLFTNCV